MRNKLFILILLFSILFSNVVLANSLEDIAATYPKLKIKSYEYVNDSGKTISVKYLDVFKGSTDGNSVRIRLKDTDGSKEVLLIAERFGSDWLFIQNVFIGDGENSIKLSPHNDLSKEREVFGIFVHERFINILNQSDIDFMKNATIMRIHGEKYYISIPVNFKNDKKISLQKAMEIADEFLDDKE